MQARDIMTTGVITVGPDAEVAEITKCLLDNRISAVPVVEPDGRLVGIVSEGDLIRRPEMGTERRRSWWLSLLLLPEHSAIDYIKTHGRHARDVMTRELITVNDDAMLEEIAEILEKRRIKRVREMFGFLRRHLRWRERFLRSLDQRNHPRLLYRHPRGIGLDPLVELFG